MVEAQRESTARLETAAAVGKSPLFDNRTNTMNLNGFASAPSGAKPLLRLDEAHDQVAADGCGKWDLVAKREDITLKDGLVALSPNGDEKRLTPTSWATGQLCARLGIPTSYFRKCPTILQDVQANFWLKDANSASGGQSDRWFLRAKDDTLRAVLSDRYSPLDNTTLMECLRPMLDARYRVDWFGLSDESLHLRIIDPQRTREVLPDDALSVGIHLTNSEVGFRSVTVDSLVYRLVCTNGLIRMVKGKSLLRQRHIHLAQPRFVAALEEALQNALCEADGFIEQLRCTTTQPVPDVENTLNRLAEHHSLSETTRQAMFASLLQEPFGQSETVYGLVNALTNAAQRLPDENRYDLEVLAGHLAQHGVAGYAPRQDEKPPKGRRSEADHDSGEFKDPEKWSPVEAAREMFEAQVMGRIPHSPREVEV